MFGASRSISCPPELCMVDLHAATDEQVLRALVARARAHGWVENGHLDAVLARERAHPTGVPTDIPVAIPHADSHVLRGGFAAARLATPVTFGQMGNRGKTVDVRLVILLLVKDTTKQVALLGRLLAGVQDKGMATKLNAVTSPEALSALIEQLTAT